MYSITSGHAMTVMTRCKFTRKVHSLSKLEGKERNITSLDA